MSNVRLWALGNATDTAANFSSTNGDQGSLPANVITHTGGSDGDYIQVPDCSGSDYFDDHHISVSAPNGSSPEESWNVSIWADDQQNGMVCWSPSLYYAEGYNFPESQNNPNCSLLIRLVNGAPVVTWAPF